MPKCLRYFDKCLQSHGSSSAPVIHDAQQGQRITQSGSTGLARLSSVIATFTVLSSFPCNVLLGLMFDKVKKIKVTCGKFSYLFCPP